MVVLLSVTVIISSTATLMARVAKLMACVSAQAWSTGANRPSTIIRVNTKNKARMNTISPTYVRQVGLNFPCQFITMHHLAQVFFILPTITGHETDYLAKLYVIIDPELSLGGVSVKKK